MSAIIIFNPAPCPFSGTWDLWQWQEVRLKNEQKEKVFYHLVDFIWSSETEFTFI